MEFGGTASQGHYGRPWNKAREVVSLASNKTPRRQALSSLPSV